MPGQAGSDAKYLLKYAPRHLQAEQQQNLPQSLVPPAKTGIRSSGTHSRGPARNPSVVVSYNSVQCTRISRVVFQLSIFHPRSDSRSGKVGIARRGGRTANAPVLKTGVRKDMRVRIPPPPLTTDFREDSHPAGAFRSCAAKRVSQLHSSTANPAPSAIYDKNLQIWRIY